MALLFTPLIIDGERLNSSDGATFEVRNPYSNEVIGSAASASSADCRAAIEAAARAFKTWEHTTPWARRDILLKAADIVGTERFKTLIVEATSEETAATRKWGFGNWATAAPFLRTHASLSVELTGKTFPSDRVPGGQVHVQKRAQGVIFSIAPWNAPFTLSIRAVAMPLLCGNTVILKSSEYSPRSQALVAQLFEEAGLPPGVLNFISMSRESAPALTAEIIAHPLVRKINFTGSDRVGRIIATEAGKHLKPCVFELGGKGPAVVLDDADLTEAAKAIVVGSLVHSGQVCMSTERVIVQRGAAKALIDMVKTLASEVKAGDPSSDSTVKLGALFTEGSADNILGMIREAQNAGAKLLMGDLGRKGSVMQPHILADVKPGMRLWERESFGPVISFTVVDTPEEAVELANATDYSLSASIWSSNMSTAQKFAPLIRAGYTNINGSTFHSEPLISVAGLSGSSGYGHFGIYDFTDERAIITHPTGASHPQLAL